MSTFWGTAENKCLLLRVQFIQFRLGTGRTPNTSPVVLNDEIGTWVHIGAIQVQGVAIVVIVRSRRPIVAAGPSTAGRRRNEVAGVEEVIGIRS